MEKIDYEPHLIKINDIHHCKTCNKYKSERLDNVKRHIREVHLKKSILCECGTFVKQSVLNRHKQKHCKLREQKSIDGTNTFS